MSKKVYLLDCTLRDGGYVNDWNFGEKAIKDVCAKMSRTGVEIVEVGFLKGDTYNPDKTLFPNLDSVKNVIHPKDSKVLYVGMLDMSSPLPIDRIPVCDGSSLDGIRVIFKKDKMDEGFRYCQRIKELGYWLSVNFVSTDLYTDKEFIEGIERFNVLKPDAMAIVDTFGLIKRKQFMRLAYIADNNMAPGIILCYHAHNNLQQASGNAEALVEMNLKRDICIDGSVFGMGRGAGNLNLELFADFMNENYGTGYKIEPMLELIDEYLGYIYKKHPWGYSLPLYLSAVNHCHPNYAIHISEKDSLNVKSFNEFFKSIPDKDKAKFSKDKAELYYRKYQEQYVDDKSVVEKIANEISGKTILLLAPGNSIVSRKERINDFINTKKPLIFTVNFVPENYHIDYVFSSHIRRFTKIPQVKGIKYVVTSNIQSVQTEYRINYASYASVHDEIIDNSGLMLLKFLMAAGCKEIYIAGMDGYKAQGVTNYCSDQLEYDFAQEIEKRNLLIGQELRELNQSISIKLLTPSEYSFNE